MLTTLAFTPILGLPAMVWPGMLVFILLIIQIIAGSSILAGKPIMTIHYHVVLAWIIIVVGFLHGLFAVLAFLGV